MIEYVTKNEETDELELKPISYGIPEIASKEDPTALDYNKVTIFTLPYTVTQRGVIVINVGLYNRQSSVVNINGQQVFFASENNAATTNFPGTFIVTQGDVITHGGGIVPQSMKFIPFKVQYD